MSPEHGAAVVRSSEARWQRNYFWGICGAVPVYRLPEPLKKPFRALKFERCREGKPFMVPRAAPLTFSGVSHEQISI
jgi:hypothetical protein